MEIKEFAYVAQSLAVAVAVLVGGGWALFRHYSLRSIQHAKADLEKTRVEIEKAHRTLLERGIVNIELRAEQFLSGDDYLIGIQVTLRNTGSGTEVLDWSKSGTTASKVILEPNGGFKLSEEPIVGFRPDFVTDSTLAPGEVDNYSYIIRVPDSGIYYVRFVVACSLQLKQLINEERKQAGIEESGDTVWGRDLFFHVKNVETQEANK